MFKKVVDTGYTDMYTYLWRPSLDSKISINTDEVLSVLEPLCRTCLALNPRNMGWLRMMADLSFAEHNYKTSMRYYLEIGSLSTNCFSRSVPFNIWDEKVYKHLLACLEKEKAFTMALVLCQFFEPIDYPTALRMIKQRSSDDGSDIFYECVWDVTILEYIIYAHDKRGEEEKKKAAVAVEQRPELNRSNSPQMLQQTAELKKTKFLRILCRHFWN
jgi:integrator complex subunit 8